VSDRQYRLKQIYHCLNTPEGKVLVDELGAILDGPELFDTDPLVMAQNVAGRDIYKLLVSFQNGDSLNDR
jgi:hypothetical protein